MSKIGDAPVTIPASVQFKLDLDQVTVKGNQGELKISIPAVLEIKQEGDKIRLKAKNASKKSKSMLGLYRQILSNAVKGVETLWTRKLEVIGTGFNVKPQGEDIVFKIGYSHPVVFKKNSSIKFRVEGNNKVAVMGMDKQLVGQTAYQIKMIKKPDVYKGKGIRYEGEFIKLKPGKKVKAAGAAA